MRVISSNSIPTNFNPVDLTITFESEDELQAFHAIFNFTPICDAVRPYGLNTIMIREELENHSVACATNNIDRLFIPVTSKIKKWLGVEGN